MFKLSILFTFGSIFSSSSLSDPSVEKLEREETEPDEDTEKDICGKIAI